MGSLSDATWDRLDSSDSESHVQDQIDDECSPQVTRERLTSLSRSGSTISNQTPTEHVPAADQPAQQARKRGRPPGSKNKNTLAAAGLDVDGLPLSKKQKQEAKETQKKEAKRTKEMQRKFKEGLKPVEEESL
ncbi:hypothetical protein FNAPI_14066, partial [Fusarium napiforme]